MEREALTSRQKDILEFMETFTRDAGYPPTVREICKATGLKSPRSVSQHLQALERKKYIARGKDMSRAIRFLHRTVDPGFPDVVKLALVGRVAAGTPSGAAAPAAATYHLDAQLVPNSNCYLMLVDGDCMTGAHIADGDMIIVDPDGSAASGDIVVARIGDTTTVKRYETRGGATYLVPQNATMQPIDLSRRDADSRILGRVVGLVRKTD